MCNCECCGQEIEEFEEELTREELIEIIIDEVNDGACATQMLNLLFDLAYDLGQKELAEESRDFYQDILDDVEE